MAIQAAIRETFPALTSKRPPIRIDLLAVSRGITGVVARPLDCDGIISSISPGEYLIEVNQAHGNARRRFTVAHEIGHTFFFELDSSRIHKGFRLRDVNIDDFGRSAQEELLCNYAAAELLMPFRQFAELLGQQGLGAKTLIQLARVFDVSLRACAKKVVQVLPNKLAVVSWEYDQETGSYVSRWNAGMGVRVRQLAQRLIVKKREPAFAVMDSGKEYRGRLWISLGGPADHYFLDKINFGSPDRREVLTIFVLERHPELVLGKRGVCMRSPQQLALI